MTALAYETWQLGARSFRRFYRVPANWIGIIFFPLLQLFVFSQLYKDIVQLPGFAGNGGSYLAYLAPGQVAFAAFFTTAWSGAALIIDYHNGYLDKLRATPIHQGRSQQVWVVETHDTDGRLIARGQVRVQNLSAS